MKLPFDLSIVAIERAIRKLVHIHRYYFIWAVLDLLLGSLLLLSSYIEVTIRVGNFFTYYGGYSPFALEYFMLALFILGLLFAARGAVHFMGSIDTIPYWVRKSLWFKSNRILGIPMLMGAFWYLGVISVIWEKPVSMVYYTLLATSSLSYYGWNGRALYRKGHSAASPEELVSQ